MGAKGPAALARAVASVILTQEEMKTASLTGKRDSGGRIQASKLDLIKETVFNHFCVPIAFQDATWREIKSSLTQMLKYKSKKGTQTADTVVSTTQQ